MPLNRAGFARPTPCHPDRLLIATRPPSQAGDESARLPRLHLEAPPHPLPRALRCALAARSDRATPPAAQAGDEPARPVSLRRATLTGQPLRRPMAWRRAAYRRPPCPFMHSFCGQVPELLRPARAGAGIHRVPEKEAAYRPGVVLMVASSRAAAARHRAAPSSPSLRPVTADTRRLRPLRIPAPACPLAQGPCPICCVPPSSALAFQLFQ